MVVVQQRLVRGTHIGKDLKTGSERLYMCDEVLKRSKQTGHPGHDIVEQEVRGHDDPQLLSRRWPERFEMIQGALFSGDPETQMKPDETLNQFAARMVELAKSRTITSAEVLNPTDSQPQTGGQAKDLSTFDAMTVKELQAHAAGEEIDLKGATKKEEILNIIKAAYGV